MINKVLSTIFGTKDGREIKRINHKVKIINDLEDEFEQLSDSQLTAKTTEFRDRLSKGETLDDLMPEAFATVREASKRVLGMRHFDVQLIGGIVLHEGKIAEMKTGEGKTLVATCPVYLNALSGKGVHVITVNDYLAKRDRDWMNKVYNFLGMTSGVVIANITNEERKAAYKADITYGTNNEFGFDYLRDNMTNKMEERVQRDLNYVIVDEVDSILIDEARTPLIISGSSRDTLKVYELFSNVVKQLKRDSDYEVHEKENSVLLKEEGIHKVEKLLKIDNLYSSEHVGLTHYLNQSLKAKELFKKDKDYIVRDGKVIIVDEFTGRLMDGRRYSEGLHQSIEAKERVRVASENQTLASITLQNYFRMYKKLSGMTGTAKTEEGEFVHIYKLSAVAIPTNRPIQRIDHSDMVYVTAKEKLEASVDKIEETYKKGQPILVGTASIESSEVLSNLLKQKNIPHNVLNAKNHEREAEIVAQAGQIGAVTIATNMAGRGTDIVLGGNPVLIAKSKISEDNPKYDEEFKKIIKTCSEDKGKILELGGLYILGTERHESRRIDNQLRGRSGRQGDPGESSFFISLEDDLMRMFGSDRVAALITRMGYEYKDPIHHPMVNNSIANAQKRVEAKNFSVRKQLLEYDNVMNKQREVIYRQRNEILSSSNLDKNIKSIINKVVNRQISLYMNFEDKKLRNYDSFKEFFKDKMDFDISMNLENMNKEEILTTLCDNLYKHYEDKMRNIENKIKIERDIMLQVIDGRWKENLATLDGLRESIHLRSYAQRDPIVEYKLASSRIYMDMANITREEIISFLFKVEI